MRQVNKICHCVTGLLIKATSLFIEVFVRFKLMLFVRVGIQVVTSLFFFFLYFGYSNYRERLLYVAFENDYSSKAGSGWVTDKLLK